MDGVVIDLQALDREGACECAGRARDLDAQRRQPGELGAGPRLVRKTSR
jgi:hypothetical protein